MLESESLLSSIERQIADNPKAIAVCDESQIFSYHDLGSSVNRLANYLVRHQVEHGDIVALYMRRSFDLLVAMWAAWKVNATYLCLDWETPPARLVEIIQQSRPKCIVTEPALLNALPSEFPILTCQDPELFDSSSKEVNQAIENEGKFAYLIYTSGSTAQPKGVLITHHNLVNYIFWFNEHFQITKEDIFSFNSSPAFDFAVTCIHAPLVAGAQVLITNEPHVLDLASYCHQLTKYRVTFVKWTPSYFKLLLDYVEKYKVDLSHLRYLMIAGEELLTSYVERWFAVYPSHTIINEYGPTETTVGITTQIVTKSNLNRQLKTVPIGQSIRNTRLYVVDASNRLLPQGEVGELWIGGASVGSGYYKSLSLTQARFIKNPFTEQEEKVYKTGDLVKQLPDETYLYMGRIDSQVKINGFRVELNEVEHCLIQRPEIAQACVVVREDRNKNRYLEAYLVLKTPAHSLDVSLLNKEIAHYLPRFMIPQSYYPIDRIPLTPNGKVDYRALVTQLSFEGK